MNFTTNCIFGPKIQYLKLNKTTKVIIRWLLTYQFSVARTGHSGERAPVHGDDPSLGVAGDGLDVHPSAEVLHRLGVHVGLLGAGVLAPHVSGAGELGGRDVELSTAVDAGDSTLGSVQELDETGHELVVGAGVAQTTVAAEAPAVRGVALGDCDLEEKYVIKTSLDFLDFR